MAAMRVATWCERCGSAVAESGIWIGRSGVRVYCSACGYLLHGTRVRVGLG